VAGKVAEASDWAVAMATDDSQHWGEPDRGSRAQVTGPRRHPRKEISQGRRKEKVEEKGKRKGKIKKEKNLMNVGPTCQWLIPLLLSQNQIENRVIPSLLNQTINAIVLPLKTETGPSYRTLTPNETLA
jgi:hypothetical protein